VQALGTGAVDAAVGDQGPVERDADLPAVGVPGEQELVAVGREAAEVTRLGGVHHAQAQVGVGGGRPGDEIVTVEVDVGVVDAAHRDVEVTDLDAGGPVVHVQPPLRLHGGTELLPGQGGDVL